MPELVPKWVMRRYLILRKDFDYEEFNFEQAKEVLEEEPQLISMLLSELKKNGWVDVRIDSEDSRKRIYKLRPAEKVLKEIEKEVNKDA